MGNVKTRLSRTERYVAIASVGALALLFVLFHLITIDGAVIAQGRVVVQGKPRPVESPENGVVRDIDVRNGDVVTAGQVLVRLDPTLMRINRNIIRGRLAELIARRARLEAEQGKLDDVAMPDIPQGLEARAVAVNLAGQREIFQTRRAVMDSRKAQLREQISQYDAKTSGLEAQIEATESQIAFITREVGNLLALTEKGLVPESKLLEKQGRQAALLGEAAQRRSELARIRNSIRDAELKMRQAEQEFHEKVVTELRDVTAKIDENTLELAKTTETMSRLDVRAPVSGIVHELQVWTTGSVVSSQETLLTVIPVSDGVEFEARVAPNAINTVYIGQPARLRFPSFNQRTTPELNGTISGISPDSVADPKTGRAFYRIVITLSRDELARLGEVALIPGMPLEVFLQTGERSVLSFLVKPFIDRLAHAFRES